MPQPIRLKYLLQQRHWQTHRTFCAEYDAVAATIDQDLIRTWPSRAQLHRWLSGELKGLPYPHHCRILEKMFPGWSAAQLFAPPLPDEVNLLTETVQLSPDQAVRQADDLKSGLKVFIDLNDQDNRLIAQRIRAGKNVFFAAHTGYNALVSQYQSAIRDAIATGCKLRVVITDPDGPLMAQSELTRRLCPSIRQEGEIQDVLRACARFRQEARKSNQDSTNVQTRVYSGVPNMNALLVDGWLRVIPYLPLVDGAECPVFEHEFNMDQPSALVAKYLLSINRIWEDAKAVDLD